MQRRLQLCTNFAIKLYKSDISSEFFTHKQPRANSRTDQQLVVENFSRTKRSYNAPHNFLARLINQNISKIKKWVSQIRRTWTSKKQPKFVTHGLLGHCPIFGFVLKPDWCIKILCAVPYHLFFKINLLTKLKKKNKIGPVPN